MTLGFGTVDFDVRTEQGRVQLVQMSLTSLVTLVAHPAEPFTLSFDLFFILRTDSLFDTGGTKGTFSFEITGTGTLKRTESVVTDGASCKFTHRVGYFVLAPGFGDTKR